MLLTGPFKSSSLQLSASCFTNEEMSVEPLLDAVFAHYSEIVTEPFQNLLKSVNLRKRASAKASYQVVSQSDLEPNPGPSI